MLSPTTAVYDRTAKSQRYAHLGVQHYWLIDPSTTRLECSRAAGSAYVPVVSGGHDDTVTHPDFPGLTPRLAAIFA